ncbi:MAG: hypothetical protein HFG74_10015 [Hungatella sp.]|nr:hypothetical protein [Hungatella sp.]
MTTLFSIFVFAMALPKQVVMLNSRAKLTVSLCVATWQQEFSTNYGVIMALAAEF